MKEKHFSQEFCFNGITTEFQWTNAYGCAMASVLVYEKEETIKKQIESWKAEYKFIEGNGTQALVMATNDIILVAFRGTELKTEDILTDLNFDLVKGPLDGEVHEGFLDALAVVWKKVEMTIAKFRKNQAKSLWFTGHSLGAGLATLAVGRLVDQGQPVDGLYTFGQPRTGDKAFARDFNFEFKPYAFRFVNNNDIVTRVPPRSFGYRHIGTLRYFDEKGCCHEDISRWNRFLDRIHGRIEDILEWGTDGTKDHGMDDYLMLVYEKYEGEQKKEAERNSSPSP